MITEDALWEVTITEQNKVLCIIWSFSADGEPPKPCPLADEALFLLTPWEETGKEQSLSMVIQYLSWQCILAFLWVKSHLTIANLCKLLCFSPPDKRAEVPQPGPPVMQPSYSSMDLAQWFRRWLSRPDAQFLWPCLQVSSLPFRTLLA